MTASLRDAATGGTVIPRLEVAQTSWARFRGLMLRPPLSPGSALLIRPCKSIHMCFMRFAIDAVFIDARGRVTRVARDVRPWLGFAWGGRHARAVIELPAGSAGEMREGQVLEVVEAPS